MKMKKLLAAALAATMMLSSMVTSMVASAETTNAVEVAIADIAVGATEFTANFDIDFDPAVDGPHLMFDVDAEGATLTDIKSNTDGITVEAKDGGANLAEGMFITEGAGGKEFDDMSLTATFTLAEAAAEGDTITVNVAVTDNADWNENAIVIAAGTDSFTLEVAAPECDHANKTFKSAVPATETEYGKIYYDCPDCDVEEIYEDVIYDKKASLATPAIECGATTQLIFRITTKNYSTAEAALLTVEHTMFTGEKDNATYTHEDFVYDATLASNKWTLPVISTNFNDKFVATLYVCRDGVWYSGITRNTSVTESAMASITGTSATEEVKITAANLLKMGSEIQKKFKVNVENLPDAGLVGDYAKYVTTTIPSVMYDETNYKLADTTIAKTEGKVALSKPSITLSDAMIINMNAVVSYYKDSAGNVKTINDFKAVYSYTAANGAKVNEAAEYVIDDRGRYVLSIPVAAPNMSSVITVQIFDGDTPISDATICSVESILAVNVEADAGFANLAYAAINYSIASRAL